MLVELDVFSGRPNPRWELDERRSEELVELQNRLTTTNQPQAEPPGLGYRGFWYSETGGRVRAYKGYLTTPRGVFADPSFTVERFLLDQLPPEYAALRPRIAPELDASKP